MYTNFDLKEYLNNGVHQVAADLTKASIFHPMTLKYMTQFAAGVKEAEKKREQLESEGHHIPPFLLGSITDACNLRCKGCYAHRADDCRSQQEGPGQELLPVAKWNDIFRQSEDMGVNFFILAGGEPFMRPGVIEMAAKHKKILFPVITNGLLINSTRIKFLKSNRNIIPVLSVEGDAGTTDARRGEGIYALLEKSMEDLHKAGILFGASITVTKENMEEVLSDKFVDGLESRGCRGVIYIEYVPADADTDELTPDDDDREIIMKRIDALRTERENMIFIAFPGDEQAAGGCLAAGRGFFHINPYGGAEPCPFSPYSDMNIRDVTLLEALDSPLFRALTSSELLAKPHKGGCTLFQYEDEVKAMQGLA